MNTQDFERILDDKAKEAGYENWNNLLWEFQKKDPFAFGELTDITKEAAMQFAKECQPKWVSVEDAFPETKKYVLCQADKGAPFTAFLH